MMKRLPTIQRCSLRVVTLYRITSSADKLLNTTISCSDHILDHYVNYYKPLEAFQKSNTIR